MPETDYGHQPDSCPDTPLRNVPSADETFTPLVQELAERYALVDGGDRQGSRLRRVTDHEARAQTSRGEASADLQRLNNWLVEAHGILRRESQEQRVMSSASEWILDNFYVIRQAVRQIREDLPLGYYRRLPKLVEGPLAGIPRIYALSRDLLAYQNYHLHFDVMQPILVALQEHLPLTMGELWAVPIFLRYVLVEALAHTLVPILAPETPPDLPPLIETGSALAHTLHEPEPGLAAGPEPASVASIVMSLRAIGQTDWKDFFEAVSVQEAILRRDPAGLYARMDFETRDLYRKEVEGLALVTERAEREVAEQAIALAAAGGTGAAGATAPDAAGATDAPGTATPYESPLPDTAGREEMANGTGPQASDAQGVGAPRSGAVPADAAAHVGTYLIGPDRKALEAKLSYVPDGAERFGRWARRNASSLYFAGIAFTGLVIYALIALIVYWIHGMPWLASLGIGGLLVSVVALIPLVLIAASSLVNHMVTVRATPDRLPKIEFLDEIPTAHQTLVAVPALIGHLSDIDRLVRRLEIHYLSNPHPGLFFALLSDYGDADHETMPEDEELLTYACDAINALNERYGVLAASEAEPAGAAEPATTQRFFLLHRRRLWNPAQARWMGWERKRGKLHELNQFLRGATGTTFLPLCTGEDVARILRPTRYVITLDADTVLPPGAARRLIGTLAHPLNQAVFNEHNRVISGYTVLQPRMETHPGSVSHSWFTRVYAGDTGLDLYTHAVSDAYQDLFGEGSYVGKGIYDVDAFARSVEGRIPENTLLSHDLLEGIMGRAGLVTDVTMVEDYPPSYFATTRREHRWIRGDWQLLPWLLQPRRFHYRLSNVDAWKIIHNLLRSLLPVALIVFLWASAELPGYPWLWLLAFVLAYGIPLATSVPAQLMQVARGEHWRINWSSLGYRAARLLLAVALVPYDAYIALDAIAVTLYRVLFSRRNLLTWTTAEQTARHARSQSQRRLDLGTMMASAVVAAALVIAMQVSAILRGDATVENTLVPALPLVLLWLSGPALVMILDRPVVERQEAPTEEHLADLRRIGRRTWSFFLRFVGPQDHWLPPDHFQETPIEIIAHHTSPSNIGLYLTSVIAAYDLGYLHQLGMAARLSATMVTLSSLPRYRGHFLNWYDTQTLAPLHPRYVSTVDSGNLAASLIVVARAVRQINEYPVLRWHAWQGYLDTMAEMLEVILPGSDPRDPQVLAIQERVEALRTRIEAAQSDPMRWYALCDIACGEFWPDFSRDLAELIRSKTFTLSRAALRQLREVAAQASWHHEAVQTTLNEMVPWVMYLQDPPQILLKAPYAATLAELESVLLHNPQLGQIGAIIETSQTLVARLREQIAEEDAQSPSPEGADARAYRQVHEWLAGLSPALLQASNRAARLRQQFEEIAIQAETMVNEMDYGFLYHPRRHVFHIGYNLDTGQLDENYYDLLASEARIASIIAIAQGQVPPQHWLQLGRPITRVGGLLTLLSWSATMFEYLMPTLYLRAHPGTLLQASAVGAVRHQIAYGEEHSVPWGVSESGFYLFDANQNYQYRAFGTPGLGFKRGLGDDLVVAPYASLLALRYAPMDVMSNISALRKNEGYGLYGFYEAIDYTPDRLPANAAYAVVREYMSHHQGMILMSLVNYLQDDIMVRRMHSDPRIQSVELLLQEQVPVSVPLQHPDTQSMEGTARASVPLVDIQSWIEPANTETPRVNLLSNGQYSVMVSSRGGGYSTWNGVDLTRFRPDGTLDPWGTWVYVQELHSGESGDGAQGNDTLTVTPPWSAAHLPMADAEDSVQTAIFAHMSVYRRVHDGVSSTMEVTVSAEDPLEIRRVHLINNEDRTRVLRLTSYSEIVLGDQAGDIRHPAFNKMFTESDYVPELNLQVFTRRGHTDESRPAVMGHMLVVRSHSDMPEAQAPVRHESDRMAFIGRGRTLRNPRALESIEHLTGTTGMTLDPILSVGTDIVLGAHGSRELAFITLAAPDRPTLLALARQYMGWEAIERTFHEADVAVLTWLGRRDLHTEGLKAALNLASALLYPDRNRRSAPATLAANRLSQSGLWRLSISGDYPIILLELDDVEHLELVSEVVLTHELLSNRELEADLVILNRQPSGYASSLTRAIQRRISQADAEVRMNQRGGIFVLSMDQMQPGEVTLLRAAAAVVLLGERGSLSQQMNEQARPVTRLPQLMATHASRADLVDPEWPEPVEFTHANGYGGFSEDGREYIIDLAPGEMTPMPWSNVIAYPEFGMLATEAGSQTTWAVNSGENRLSPWSNDPVMDPTGEALYLRDEETGDLWSPTVLPAGAPVRHRVRHGAGYTVYTSASHGLRQEMAVFASPTDPVKIVRVRLENTLDIPRRLTVTQYVEWVLGTVPGVTGPYLVPEYDAETACLTVRNPYHMELGQRTAFMTASRPLHGYTADRAAFLGADGSLARPAALETMGLEPRVEPGGDTCGALQVHLDVKPGACEELYFIIGQGEDAGHAADLAQRYRDAGAVQAAWDETNAYWDGLLERIQVRTPNPSVDLMLNRWLLYQSLSCRLNGRSAFYQSSGAFGFRDQLQDSLAWLSIDPGITREQILNAALRQFEEGDVLHWWHPPSGRGVRTRIADNLLWLPFVVASYLKATGDEEILAEELPFLDAPPLTPHERERYGEYPHTQETFPLLEHCLRAIEKGSTRGRHGLPLIGTGDWNDGLNNVGAGGEGESVWMAWFLYDILMRWADILEARGDTALAQSYRRRAEAYAAATEASSWDGAWYVRAFYDDGAPLGSCDNVECRIDALSQSWAVLSGGGDPERSRQGMDSVSEQLIRPEERLSLLFTPPFDRAGPNPGYIMDYPPGIRENGGQYSHASVWTAWAFAALGDGLRAGELMEQLYPVGYSESRAQADRYRVEPYVISADVYSEPPYVGRGGWTWYTGSASWAWRLGVEGILGFTREGDALRMAPVIPPQWDGYEIRYRYGESEYTIRVHNPEHVSQGVQEITLDGEPLRAPWREDGLIPLRDDGQAHTVGVTLGTGTETVPERGRRDDQEERR